MNHTFRHTLTVQTRENDAISYMTDDKIRRFINLACAKISKAVLQMHMCMQATHTHNLGERSTCRHTYTKAHTHIYEGFVQYPGKNKNK